MEIIDIGKLLSLKRTLQTFLKVNGYDNDEDPDFIEMNENEFEEYIENVNNIDDFFLEIGIPKTVRNSLSNIYNHRNNDLKIFVYLYDNEGKSSQVSIDAIKKFSQGCINANCFVGVIICETELSHAAADNFNLMNVGIESKYDPFTTYFLTYFNDKYFIDITKSNLVPKILKIYSKDKALKFFEENKIKPAAFPKIYVTDPLAKFYLLRVGDLIEMEATVGIQELIAKKEIRYRVVIAKPSDKNKNKKK